jgi:hypothetical protein
MNAFQRKSLYAALAGAGALGAATTAQAVNVNPNGLGQVLLYPYYTVNTNTTGQTYNSLLSVINSTDSVKVVKVRFLEGKDSREVIDFNLFLSPFDVWTGAIIPSPSTTGGRLITFDKSCTVPPIATTQGGPGFVDFVNYAYTGTNDDKGGSGLDRTREGYVEIIEMGTFTSTDTVAVAVTHANGSVAGQPDCKPISDTLVSHEIFSNSGGLFGGMSLVNVAAGTDYSYDAVALDNFAGGGFLFYSSAGSTTPDLTFAKPPISQVVAFGAFFSSSWAGSNADPVSAVLMHDQVMNEYALDAATKSGTDWVITFPTKRFYIKSGTGLAPKLFQRNFNDGAGSCDDVTLNIFDREEKTTSTPTTFSPPPPTPGNAICWEANIVTFNSSNVLASANTANINTSFEHGWLNLGFFPATITGAVHTLANSNTIITPAFGSSFLTSVTYFGLPLVGFAVESFTNGNVGGVLSAYGSTFVHRTTVFID